VQLVGEDEEALQLTDLDSHGVPPIDELS